MNLLERLISVVAPHECLSCHDEGWLLCKECCLYELVAPAEVCMFCNKLSGYGQTCMRCLKMHPIKNVWVASTYERFSKQLVQHTKYQEQRAGVLSMVQAMHDSLPSGIVVDAVVGVPTITSHVRMRGFDHTALIAKLLAAKLGVPCLNALVRLDQSAQQGGSRKSRVQSVQGNIRLAFGSDVNGLTLLIVDDVATTGATISETAKTLKRAGAKTIYASIFARA